MLKFPFEAEGVRVSRSQVLWLPKLLPESVSALGTRARWEASWAACPGGHSLPLPSDFSPGEVKHTIRLRTEPGLCSKGGLVLLSPAGQSPSPHAGATEPRLRSSSPLSHQVTLGQVLPLSLLLLQEEGVPATEGWVGAAWRASGGPNAVSGGGVASHSCDL